MRRWHWIFFLNLPLGVLALLLALRLVPGEPIGERRPFDWPGFVLTAAACSRCWGVRTRSAGRTCTG